MKKKEVISYFDGSVKTVAEKLSISPSSVSQWNEVIPERQALKLSIMTDNVLAYDDSVYQKIKKDRKEKSTAKKSKLREYASNIAKKFKK